MPPSSSAAPIRRIWLVALSTVWTALAVGGTAWADETLDAVKERDRLRCGASNQTVSAEWTGEGRWRGFDVDFCRAIAAAVLGDADKIEIVLLAVQLRIPALVENQVDVLFGSLTWNYRRDAGQPIDFAAITFYDGQGFIGFADRVPRRLLDLRNATVCVPKGTTSARTLTQFIDATAPTWRALVMESEEGAERAFWEGRCDLNTADVGHLVGLRALSGMPNVRLFPDIISKEPLSAAVRTGDVQWLKIVRWVINATVAAEEAGVGRETVEAMARAGVDQDLAPLLGLEPGFGRPLGLPDTWAYEVVRQVGNYAEIFDRNLGSGSRLNLDRGLNSLWTEGGLLYAPPLR